MGDDIRTVKVQSAKAATTRAVMPKLLLVSLLCLIGLPGLAGCTATDTSDQDNNAALQPYVGVWELDCGYGFVLFKLVVTKDLSATFDWQTYNDPESGTTTTDRMDLRLESVNNAVVATVVRADVDHYVGKTMRISLRDVNSIILHEGERDAVLDSDQTLYRESVGQEIDCPGD